MLHTCYATNSAASTYSSAVARKIHRCGHACSAATFVGVARGAVARALPAT
jgi:hypothetical protein